MGWFEANGSQVIWLKDQTDSNKVEDYDEAYHCRVLYSFDSETQWTIVFLNGNHLQGDAIAIFPGIDDNYNFWMAFDAETDQIKITKCPNMDICISLIKPLDEAMKSMKANPYSDDPFSHLDGWSHNLP